MNYKGLSRMVSCVMDGKITNPKFLRLMRNAGLEGVSLYKGDGYFYISSDVYDVYSWYENAIYMNSFNQQSPEEWVVDIKRLIVRNRELGR